jgi:hypothetical protein
MCRACSARRGRSVCMAGVSSEAEDQPTETPETATLLSEQQAAAGHDSAGMGAESAGGGGGPPKAFALLLVPLLVLGASVVQLGGPTEALEVRVASTERSRQHLEGRVSASRWRFCARLCQRLLERSGATCWQLLVLARTCI